MKKPFKYTLIALGVVATVGVVTACNHYDMSHEDRVEYATKKITKKLDLNPPQVEKLDQLANAIVTAHDQMHVDHDARKQELLALLDNEPFDRTKVISTINQKADEFKAQAPAVVDALGELIDSLSPEQKAELKTHVTKKMDRHHGRWH